MHQCWKEVDVLNKDEQVKSSRNDLFYPFLFLSHQLLSPVAEKKNKFISFCERSPDNHTRFQTKMFKIYTRFQTKTAKKQYPLGRHIPIYLI